MNVNFRSKLIKINFGQLIKIVNRPLSIFDKTAAIISYRTTQILIDFLSKYRFVYFWLTSIFVHF